MQPLSDHERLALIRILALSVQDPHVLQPRQKAALDAYLCVLSQPPLDAIEVLSAARALIRTWAQVSEAARTAPARKPSDKRANAIPATLLDDPVTVSDGTDQLSPLAMNAVLDSYGYR